MSNQDYTRAIDILDKFEFFSRAKSRAGTMER